MISATMTDMPTEVKADFLPMVFSITAKVETQGK